MAKGGRGRRNILQTLNDSKLIKRYRLDRAGIIFVADLIRDELTSPTQRHNAISPEMKVITTLRYLSTGKMQQCSSDDLALSQSSISRVITQTLADEQSQKLTKAGPFSAPFISVRLHTNITSRVRKHK